MNWNNDKLNKILSEQFSKIKELNKNLNEQLELKKFELKAADRALAEKEKEIERLNSVMYNLTVTNDKRNI